jgi:hypothetical protein
VRGRRTADTRPAPQSIPFASRVRCLAAQSACRRRTALGPRLLAAGPASTPSYSQSDRRERISLLISPGRRSDFDVSRTSALREMREPGPRLRAKTRVRTHSRRQEPPCRLLDREHQHTVRRTRDSNSSPPALRNTESAARVAVGARVCDARFLGGVCAHSAGQQEARRHIATRRSRRRVFAAFA